MKKHRKWNLEEDSKFSLIVNVFLALALAPLIYFFLIVFLSFNEYGGFKWS